jgi:ABC-type multidrug transport system fused ATPase/permease subunit
MKRFLFLFFGTALAIIAGGRFFILLADHALSPNRLQTTSTIQFAAESSFDLKNESLSSAHVLKFIESERFRRPLSEALNLDATPNGKDARELFEQNVVVQTDLANRKITLTCYGWNAEGLISMAGTLATAWSQASGSQPLVQLPVSATKLPKQYLPLLTKLYVMMPFALSVSGVLLFSIGWRMPRVVFDPPPRAVVIASKY